MFFFSFLDRDNHIKNTLKQIINTIIKKKNKKPVIFVCFNFDILIFNLLQIIKSFFLYNLMSE
jgi:hypothetical protein